MSRRQLSTLLRLLLAAGSASVAVAAPAVAPKVTITTETHPAFYNDFEQDAAPLSPRPVGTLGDEPPTVEFTRPAEAGHGHYLKITNAVSGGFVGTDLLASKPPVPFTRLRFDYKADPALKVNLFARVRSVDYEIGFTGPRSEQGNTTWLGQIEGIRADGQWHSVEIPLLRWLRRPLPHDPIRLQALSFENRCTTDYLLAGFGGNAAGTALCLDGFQLVRVGGPTARFGWTVDAGEPDGYAVTCDEKPVSEPTQTNAKKEERERTFEGLRDGEHWVHVRPHAADGTWGATAHYRFEVNTEPPTAALLDPPNGGSACPETVRVKLSSKGVGVAPHSVEIKLDGIETRVEKDGVKFDPAAEELLLNLAEMNRDGAGGKPVPAVWKDGQRVELQVNCADENGLKMPKPLTGSFTLKFAADKSPPLDGRLLLKLGGDKEGEEVPGLGTFETSADEWEAFAGEPLVVERTDKTAASGKYSMRLMCTQNAAPFTVTIRKTSYDVSRYRLVSFDYKIPPRLRVDFVLQVSTTDGDTKWCRVQFCDRDTDGLLLGSVPEVKADDQWHHAEFNLYDLLRAKMGSATSYRVNMLLFSGGPWSDAMKRFPGNYAGTEFFIDNFFFVPTVGADAELVWQARDVAGVSGAQVSASPDAAKLPADTAVAGRKVLGGGTPVADFGSGSTYLWVRPFDAAGNLAPPMVTRMVVVGGRPEVVGYWPSPDGARAAPATLGVTLRPDRGAAIDPATIRLDVAGVQYPYDGHLLAYDPPTGRIIWDGRKADPPIVLKDGQEVAVKLLDVRDQAGNRPATLPAWKFTVDFKQDKTGPVVQVTSKTHTAFWYDDFQSEPLGWNWDPAGAVALKVVPDDRGEGKALRIAAERDNTAYGAMHLLDPIYNVIRFSHVCFDYNLPPGVEANLLVGFRDENKGETLRSIRLSDATTDVPSLGAVAGAVADGKWHTAIVPLAELARNDEHVGRNVQSIGFGDTGVSKATKGQGFQVANVFVCRAATAGQPRLQWSALDESGVQGYSWVLDQNPRTVPPSQTKGGDTETTIRNAPAGTCWFHIRAVDGAGNWGPTTHFLMLAPK